MKFIRESGNNPFFLYLPHTFPHIPLAASPRFLGKSPLGLYGDTVEELDWSVGEILQTLKSQGIDRDTLVMFSSDNGPWYEGSPGRLRGRKGFTLEAACVSRSSRGCRAAFRPAQFRAARIDDGRDADFLEPGGTPASLARHRRH